VLCGLHPPAGGQVPGAVEQPGEWVHRDIQHGEERTAVCDRSFELASDPLQGSVEHRVDSAWLVSAQHPRPAPDELCESPGSHAGYPLGYDALARSRNWVAACMIASSVASVRGRTAVRRPSQRTAIRSATVSSSGSSLEVMTIAIPSATRRRIRL